MRAREMMNACFVELLPTDSVQLAACAMRDELVGLVCVCDADHRPLGVVTDRDLAVRVCAAALPARKTRLRDVMTQAPLTVGLDTPAAEVETIMENNDVAKILVVDQSGRLTGTLTIAEICHYENPLAAAQVSRRLSQRQIRVQTGSGGQHPSPSTRRPSSV